MLFLLYGDQHCFILSIITCIKFIDFSGANHILKSIFNAINVKVRS